MKGQHLLLMKLVPVVLEFLLGTWKSCCTGSSRLSIDLLRDLFSHLLN